MPLIDDDAFTELYNNLDTERRDDHEFYVDCTDVRGGDELAEKLCDDLSHTTGFLHVLFSGNIGCGKSSELRHFAKSMSNEKPTTGRKRFFPVLIDTAEYLDRSNVNITDILLTIISETADTMKKELSIEFRATLIDRVWNVVKQYVPTSLEANIGNVKSPGVEAIAAQLKVSLQRLQIDPTVREKVREALAKETLTFYDEINLAFTEARLALKKHLVKDGDGGYYDFVIILDNLEKVERFDDKAEGMESHRALFVDKAEQFKSLQAHLVLTVPLELVRAEGKRLEQGYSAPPIILPNIKTEYRGTEHRPYQAGRDRLKDILRERIPGKKDVDTLFEAPALDFIIDNCGGHVRNFLRSARESVSYARYTAPISLNAAQRSIARQVRIFADVMRPDDWSLVAELELSKTQEWNGHDPARARLLEQTVVLEYVNGGTNDVYNEPRPWYGVNPIIRKMSPFTDAQTELREAREKTVLPSDRQKQTP